VPGGHLGGQHRAETAEKRRDARVAREYEVALPHELTPAQRVELVRAFAGELANRYGVAVNFTLHRPHRERESTKTGQLQVNFDRINQPRRFCSSWAMLVYEDGAAALDADRFVL